MELRDLKALMAVVEARSFTEAAHRLGFTQSAVSQQVAALEAELGQKLVERRPVRPTAAGARLAEHAAHVLLRLDVARTELAQLAGPAQVRVAASPFASPHLVAGALRRLRSTQPELEVSLSHLAPGAAVRAVAECTVDAAVVDGITGPDEPLYFADAGLMTPRRVEVCPLTVVLAAGHPLARAKSVALASLADAPWVVAPDLLAPQRWRSPVVYAGSDLNSLLELVANGLGAALVPAWAGARHPGVVAVPLKAPDIVHRTEVLSVRGGGPFVEALLAGATAQGSASGL
ncbi:MAG TPA: LysR family transcriptional regulator [Acidimicrobiales bacterium]|nr:LysR family transcriptional regulator [Acidimicrobiales bacterium]